MRPHNSTLTDYTSSRIRIAQPWILDIPCLVSVIGLANEAVARLIPGTWNSLLAQSLHGLGSVTMVNHSKIYILERSKQHGS